MSEEPAQESKKGPEEQQEPEFRFSELGLSDELMKGIEACGYQTPTPIQGKAIPAALKGRDVIGAAETGTGKTAAFLIPIFERMRENPDQRALVLAPTRELAQQIVETADGLGEALGFRSIVLVGGLSLEEDIRLLGEPWRLIIATPGRLLDHISRYTIRVDTISYLVLDEADRMLDMGFMPQINKILKAIPKERQSFLFSATIPPDISELAAANMKDPLVIEVARRSSVNRKIKQGYYSVQRNDKDEKLKRLLRGQKGRILIFARTKDGADQVAMSLSRAKFKVARIHSNRSQSQRNNALDGFRDGRYPVLVATDIAARGIDVTDIKWVINYDLPDSPEDYVHRIGRTARGDEEGGQAVSFVAGSMDQQKLQRIEKFIKAKVPPLESETAMKPQTPSDKGNPSSGDDGRRRQGRKKPSRSGSNPQPKSAGEAKVVRVPETFVAPGQAEASRAASPSASNAADPNNSAAKRKRNRKRKKSPGRQPEPPQGKKRNGANKAQQTSGHSTPMTAAELKASGMSLEHDEEDAQQPAVRRYSGDEGLISAFQANRSESGRDEAED